MPILTFSSRRHRYPCGTSYATRIIWIKAGRLFRCNQFSLVRGSMERCSLVSLVQGLLISNKIPALSCRSQTLMFYSMFYIISVQSGGKLFVKNVHACRRSTCMAQHRTPMFGRWSFFFKFHTSHQINYVKAPYTATFDGEFASFRRNFNSSFSERAHTQQA